MAKAKYVLAVDQGTTGTHVSILDDKLRVVGSSYREFTQYFPKPSWVEHDLEEIWTSVEQCVRLALKDAQLAGKDIAAVGITNQRETSGLWMREGGKPLSHAIVWQDRRTSEHCAKLREQGEEARVRQTTGLVLDPYFSGTKLSWMLEHVKGARKRAEKGEVCFGTVDTWLVYKMTGGQAHVTDVTNASRTLLMDVSSLKWDEGMRSLFGVPAECLPEIRGSAESYGTTRGMRGLPDGIPITGMAGDQQSALFGQACFTP
ncbi:MAG TPA: FGGY family carbohydrate kinase, partial [Archangium sp.]